MLLNLLLDPCERELWQAVRAQVKCRRRGNFVRGLGCLLKIKQFSWAEVHLKISVKYIQCFIS